MLLEHVGGGGFMVVWASSERRRRICGPLSISLRCVWVAMLNGPERSCGERVYIHWEVKACEWDRPFVCARMLARFGCVPDLGRVELMRISTCWGMFVE